MGFLSWQNVKNFYHYHTSSNQDFINRINEIPLTGLDDCTVHPTTSHGESTILNKDLIESNNQAEELTNLFKNYELITTRLGCVESRFILQAWLGYNHLALPNMVDPLDHLNFDKYMCKNAGFYIDPSFNEEQRKELFCWWFCIAKELVIHSTLTSCYLFLNQDIILWALMNQKKKYYNYGFLSKIILQNSEGKKILYVGSAVKSIWEGYKRGVQNAWNFPVSNFSLDTLETPVTTPGCKFPHRSIKETCEVLVKQIIENHDNYDTAIFGCGAYGPPIMEMLRIHNKNKQVKKNLIYLGSDCYKMFGVYSKMMGYEHFSEANTKNWIYVQESNPTNGRHPEPKYWK